jgi:PAS domain S-box-containing protein
MSDASPPSDRPTDPETPGDDLARLVAARTAELDWFKQTLDQTLDAVVMFDPDDMRFFYANRGARELTGYTADELARLTPAHLDPGADAAATRARIAALVDGPERQWRIETRIERKDGLIVPVAVTFQYVPLPDGKGRFVATACDLTERKRFERELREKETRYRLLLEGINIIVWEFDWRAGAFTYISGKALGRFGYPQEEWKTPGFWADHIHPDDREWAVGFCVAATEKGEDHDFIYRLTTADGGFRWLHDIVRVDRDERGEVLLRGVFVDVTDRKEAEAALETQYRIADADHRAQATYIAGKPDAEVFDELLNIMTELTDSRFGFIADYFPADREAPPRLRTLAISDLVWNDATGRPGDTGRRRDLVFTDMTKLYGLPATTGEVVVANDVATDPRATGTPEGHPALRRFLGVPLRKGETVVGVLGLANREEAYDSELLTSIRPLLATLGNIIFMVAEERRRQRLLADLAEAKERAETATKEKDAFVSIVAHDLKSPFTSIVGLLSLVEARKGNELPTKYLELFTAIRANTQRAVNLIDEVLRASRFSSGKIALKRRFFDGAYAALTSVAGYRHVADQKGVTLVNDVPEGTRLYADFQIFNEVVGNLVTNALKFTRANDTIRLFVPDDNPTAIAVADTGVGVDPTVLPHLFRHDVKTTVKGLSGEIGTGMGLPFCHDVMVAHGGDLTVAENPGGGSLFVASLPSVRPRILLADDERGFRLLLAEILRRLDVVIDEVEDGETALAAVRSNPPDLVISDLTMPKMDGFTLLRRIKTDPDIAATPVIMITSDTDLATREKAVRLGVDDFVSKPVKAEELIPRVRRFLV